MKLEKFDLEKALNGAKVVTRDGREVTQLTKFNASGEFEIYGVVDGMIDCWDDNGEAGMLDTPEGDLFLVAEPKRVWANVLKYPNGDLWVASECFPTFEAARNFAIKNQKTQLFKKGYVKTIEITDEV
jgi:hypothetical protein